MIKHISTSKLPNPAGPYSQIIISDGFIFISGQIAIDPSTGNLILGNIEEQTRTILNAVKSFFEEQQLSLNSIIKVTAYLIDPDDFNTFNKVYAEYFLEKPPVRTTVFVSSLPKNAKVEIEITAALP